VQNGTIKIGANEFPSFLYPAGTVHDPANEEEGLFKGHIFIRVSKHLSLLIYIVLGSPVPRLQKDWDWTGPRLPKTGNSQD
jgi:hypothetical protein